MLESSVVRDAHGARILLRLTATQRGAREVEAMAVRTLPAGSRLNDLVAAGGRVRFGCEWAQECKRLWSVLQISFLAANMSFSVIQF